MHPTGQSQAPWVALLSGGWRLATGVSRQRTANRLGRLRAARLLRVGSGGFEASGAQISRDMSTVLYMVGEGCPKCDLEGF